MSFLVQNQFFIHSFLLKVLFIFRFVFQAKIKITGVEGEATLRRKESNRGGPRVTRNITEAEVMNQIHELCTNGHPLDKYSKDIELGKISYN